MKAALAIVGIAVLWLWGFNALATDAVTEHWTRTHTIIELVCRFCFLLVISAMIWKGRDVID